MIGDVTQHLVAHTLVIEFWDNFVKHFNSHQFSVTIHGRCEIMVYYIQTMLNLYPNWVVLQVDVHKTFNSVSQLANFRNYGLRLVFWIIFYHLFDNFMHAHPHYIFFRLFNMGISQSFCQNQVHDKGPIGRNIVCFGSLLGSPPHKNIPPYLCFSFCSRMIRR